MSQQNFEAAYYAAVFRVAQDGRTLDIHEYAAVAETLEAVGLSE